MGRFRDVGKCIISYQEVLRCVLKNVIIKQMKLLIALTL